MTCIIILGIIAVVAACGICFWLGYLCGSDKYSHNVVSKISTTIKQSKHLLELGLDPKTADMCFEIDKGNWTFNVGKKSAQVNRGFAIPAWSLNALLEVMPKVIVHDIEKHVLCLKYAEGVAPFMYYVVESGRNKGKLIRFDNGRCVPDAYDALDAAYQMVCWLLEQGLINKRR